MSARSLNKVQLIGNLTRDPELRYTPSGTAVCSMGLATNRSWTTETGEKREDTEFHRLVAWNKLAELCSQLLTKGRKTYVEGRLSTRTWTGQDGAQRTTTEIVIDDMILLDSRRPVEGGIVPAEEIAGEGISANHTATSVSSTSKQDEKLAVKTAQKKPAKPAKGESESGETPDISPDDIPF